MSGARGCFNCGGCALLLLSSSSSPLSLSFPLSEILLSRDTPPPTPPSHSHPYLSGTLLTMFCFFFSHIRVLSCGAGGRIYSLFHKTKPVIVLLQISSVCRRGRGWMSSRPPSGDVPQGRDAHLLQLRARGPRLKRLHDGGQAQDVLQVWR
ncbi:hypothetical protein B0H19DRAFT_1139857 [Mycena capillaripes]|nr:hypothetical protein B0H19DRAFT_1139857 [Mycena capillaripes]